MMISTFETTEEDGKLHVYVEVPHEAPHQNIPRIRLETEDVLKLLSEKNIKHGKCLQASILKNWREHSRKKEWIFEISLDSSAKHVILEEEKSVQPKPKTTRKRRTRSSTKKVSTEE